MSTEESASPGNADRCVADSPPAGSPRPFIAGHRGQLVLATYGLVITTLIAIIAVASGSLTTACVFAALFTAAASILVLPAIIALLSAAEAVEIRWLCRRHEGFRRWTESRRAAAAAPAVEHGRPGVRGDFWRTLAPEALRSEVARLLASAGCRVEQVPVEADAGVDLVVCRGSRRAVVRCWADLERCGPGVARELLAAKHDFEADEAVIVAPAGGSPKLQEYRERRKFLIVDADGLAAAEMAGGLEPFSSSRQETRAR